MYGTSIHKKHKVIPLDKALPRLEDDVKSLIIKVQTEIEKLFKMTKEVNDNLYQQERLYPKLEEDMN